MEIFKHRDKIAKASHLSADYLARFYNILLRHITVFKEDLIAPENRRLAFALCQEIDETDTPHVALALELSAFLWTGDKRLKNGLSKKGFTNFFVPK